MHSRITFYVYAKIGQVVCVTDKNNTTKKPKHPGTYMYSKTKLTMTGFNGLEYHDWNVPGM